MVARARDDLAAGRPDRTVPVLRQALGLWRGQALADVVEMVSLRPAAVRLEEMRLAAEEARVDADLAPGHHVQLVGELETLTRAHPFRERLWGQLIVAPYRSNRQADALAAYRALRSALVEQMGIEPSPELQALERDVLAQPGEIRWPPMSVSTPTSDGVPSPRAASPPAEQPEGDDHGEACRVRSRCRPRRPAARTRSRWWAASVRRRGCGPASTGSAAGSWPCGSSPVHRGSGTPRWSGGSHAATVTGDALDRLVWTAPFTLRFLAEVAARLDDPGLAADLLPRLEPYGGRMPVSMAGTVIGGAADRPSAKSCSPSTGWMTRSSDSPPPGPSSAPPAPKHSPPARAIWHALALLRRARLADRPAAVALLRRTATAAGQLGMLFLREQTQRLLDERP